jgi:hypothetical protein
MTEYLTVQQLLFPHDRLIAFAGIRTTLASADRQPPMRSGGNGSRAALPVRWFQRSRASESRWLPACAVALTQS